MADKLGLKEAQAIAEAMLKAATEKGLRFSVAVVDAGGDLLHLSRMESASALNARMSYNKAYTATKWQADTKVIKSRLFDMTLGDERRDISLVLRSALYARMGRHRFAIERWNHAGRAGRKRRNLPAGRRNRSAGQESFRVFVSRVLAAIRKKGNRPCLMS